MGDCGVYQLSEAWYNDHSGGSFGPSGLDKCGTIVENFLESSQSHEPYIASLKNKENLGDHATYVGPLDCETDGLVASAARSQGLQWVQLLILAFLAFCGGAPLVTSR